MPKILFRADGNVSIGIGHVMRSIALADMLKDSFECIFAIQDSVFSLKEIIIRNGLKIIELPIEHTTHHELQDHINGIDIVVLDGYKFDDEYRKFIVENNCKLICIDDLHDGTISADAIVNHAPGITLEKYNVGPFTQLCLGPEYALLRSEFLAAAMQTRNVETIYTGFICFGGVDKHNLTLKSLKALASISQIRNVNIVVGASYAFLDELNHEVHSLAATHKIEVSLNANAEEMISMMNGSQIAIIPASSISLEVMSIGMALVLGYYVDNQKDILKGTELADCCYSIGSFEDCTQETLQNSIETYIQSNTWQNHIANQKKLIDGKSSERLSKICKLLLMEKEITIRKASNDDMRTYFNWANDIEVRSNAINPNPIIFENHEQWFSKRINSSDSFLYYFELKGVPLGQVRFDKEDGSFLIDYSVDAKFRYMGLGRVILKLAMKSLFDENVEDVKIRALVKEGNNASRKTFETLGFTQSDVVVIHGLQYQAFYKFLRK